jgi:hypothetical protein
VRGGRLRPLPVRRRVLDQVNEHDSRCLKQCSSDDDCAVPGALRCEEGVCRP